MLDRLKAEVAALKVVAGAGEQAKLDQHLTSLRELEKQLVGVTPGGGTGGGGGIGATPNPGCAAPTITPAVNMAAVRTPSRWTRYRPSLRERSPSS